MVLPLEVMVSEEYEARMQNALIFSQRPDCDKKNEAKQNWEWTLKDCYPCPVIPKALVPVNLPSILYAIPASFQTSGTKKIDLLFKTV